MTVNNILLLEDKLASAKNTDRLNILMDLAKSCLHTYPAKTVIYAKESVDLSKLLNDYATHAEAYRYMGNGCVLQGELATAISHFSESLKIEYSLDNKAGISKCFNNMAVVYSQMGNNHKALNNYLKALSLFEEQNNVKGIAACISNIGIIYKDFGEFEKASEYYKKSLRIAEKSNNDYGIAAANNNIGEIYSAKNNYNKAIEYFVKSIEKSSKINNNEITISATNNLGLNYMLKGDYDVSLGHFHNAFRLCDESEQKNTKINILINIGNNYAKLNKPDIAIGYLKIADSLFDTFISPETRMNLDHSYSEVYQQLNDFEIALSYHIDYSKLKEEIFNQSTRKKIEELQTKYQLEKKIKETELWRLRNIELKKINDTKDKFFSIIAHDLRNPIQALLGLTTYFNDNINTLDDNDIKELTLDMKESSSLLNELVGNLLEWSQLQMGGLKLEPVNFDLFELISNNCKMLYHFAEEKHIKLRLDNDSSFMVYADKNMINTIIQNIIINAIKFSNNDSTVTINIVAKKTSCYVTIKDEGVGVDAKSKDKLFKIDSNISTPGTNNELGTGLGLILCKEFIELNKGYIQLDSELGKGTSVTITIPQNKNN